MSLFRPRNTSNAIFPVQEGRFARVRKTTRSLETDGVFQEGAQGAEGHLGNALPRKRFRNTFILFGVCVFLFLGRAFHVQILQGKSYQEKAEQNRYATIIIPADRGVITDRFGELLVQNIPSFTLTMTPVELPEDPEVRRQEFARVAELAGMNVADMDLAYADIGATTDEPIAIRRGLPYESAIRLGTAIADLPGFAIEAFATRSYDTSARSISHVLGYVGNISEKELEEKRSEGYRLVDQIGKTGVEQTMEHSLRGTPGILRTEVDSLGRHVGRAEETPAISGARIKLSIDRGLQQAAEQSLASTLTRLDIPGGVVIAIDPRDGAIRALVSLPSFDSNAFADGIDPDTYATLISDPTLPLFSRAISGEYPAGSTFKPYVSYAALAEGVVTPSTSFLSVGGISVGGSRFPDWKAGGHGITDVRKALAESVNTYFYIVGGGYEQFTGLGVDRITDYARRFGFGLETGIDLPGEADGFVPSKEWKLEAKGERWYVGDTYNLSIGQGDLITTPIQLASAVSLVANKGTPVVPHVVEAVNDSALSFPSQNTFTPDVNQLQVVREGMRQAVTQGSARFLSTLPLPVAGKTGTAQAQRDQPTHAWFTGFGPYENPDLAVVVLLEYGGEGSSVAVPVARDVFSWWFANR